MFTEWIKYKMCNNALKYFTSGFYNFNCWFSTEHYIALGKQVSGYLQGRFIYNCIEYILMIWIDLVSLIWMKDTQSMALFISSVVINEIPSNTLLMQFVCQRVGGFPHSNNGLGQTIGPLKTHLIQLYCFINCQTLHLPWWGTRTGYDKS